MFVECRYKGSEAAWQERLAARGQGSLWCHTAGCSGICQD